MSNLTAHHTKAIREICQRRHVVNLYVFGSVLTDHFNQQSDIDFLVEFEDMLPEDYADNYFDFCDDLEKLLVRRVDVVTLNSVRNPYFKTEVFKTRQLVYAA